MSLFALLQKYGGVDHQEPPEQMGPVAELPENVMDWPEHWQRTYRSNVETLMRAFDFKGAEAEEVAELGTRCEYLRQNPSGSTGEE